MIMSSEVGGLKRLSGLASSPPVQTVSGSEFSVQKEGAELVEVD